MRMWMVSPKKMCRKHLLGEHLELHMFAGSINAGKKLDGYVRNNLLEPRSIRLRHAALVKEMTHRGYKHRSPIGSVLVKNLPSNIRRAFINIKNAEKELFNRCASCRVAAI